MIVEGTLKVNKDKDLGNAVEIIVADGGVIEFNNNNKINFTNNSRLIVMAGGTINGAKASIIFNNGSNGYTNYNAGNITIGTWNNNYGTTYNCGEMTIHNLLGSSTNSTYTNNGKAVVDYVGSEDNWGNTLMQKIINNCYFVVNYSCKVNHLTMTSSSYLKAASIVTGGGNAATASIWSLGENSKIECAGSMSLNIANISGPTNNNEYALLSIGNISYYNSVTSGDSKDYNTTAGYICNNVHIEISNITGDNSIYWPTEYYAIIYKALNGGNSNSQGNGNTTLANPGESPIYIPSGECTEGNTPKDDGGDDDKDEPMIWTLAFEDLGATDDFDFNDVVLKISRIAGTEKANATLLAAGGTLPAYIIVNGENLGEVHELWYQPTTTMINTGKGVSLEEKPLGEIDVSPEFSISKAYEYIKIRVTQKSGDNDDITLPAYKGEAPQCICIAGDWKWPKENVRIDDAYKSFKQWVSDYETNADWYKTHESGLVYGE